MEEKLLIVNGKDEELGEELREKCHSGEGILHRAIAVLVLNRKKKLLITQRSKFKKLWPKFWDNSCCTHVYKDETYEQAGERRLLQELGFTSKLKLLLKFQYQVRYREVGFENEICALLIGQYNGKISPNPKEVADYKWISKKELREDIDKNPEKYTPWLKIISKKYLKHKG